MNEQLTSAITPDKIPYPWIKRELTPGSPCQRGNRGRRITVVQEWLSLQGHHVSIDGEFGPATERAVAQFQGAMQIPATGIVDDVTFRALTMPMLRALTPIALEFKRYNEQIVEYAERHLAQHPQEIGGQNQGPWVRLYTSGNQGPEWAWCAGFVCFVLKQCADAMGKGMPFKSTVSCDTLAALAKERGIFVSEKNLKSGSQSRKEMLAGSIFLSRRTDTDWTHTGLVTSFGDDSFETIEGNTNDAGDREGYEVCRRIRGYGGKDFVKVL
jgi:hypothetical protein